MPHNRTRINTELPNPVPTVTFTGSDKNALTVIYNVNKKFTAFSMEVLFVVILILFEYFYQVSLYY